MSLCSVLYARLLCNLNINNDVYRGKKRSRRRWKLRGQPLYTVILWWKNFISIPQIIWLICRAIQRGTHSQRTINTFLEFPLPRSNMIRSSKRQKRNKKCLTTIAIDVKRPHLDYRSKIECLRSIAVFKPRNLGWLSSSIT